MNRKLKFDEIFSRRPSLEQLKSWPRLPIYALIENIRSMHNVGSIFRTSDAVRLCQLYLCGFTATPPRKEIDKTALGATESVPWSFSRDPVSIVDTLKKQGVSIVAVEHTTGSINYMDYVPHFPVCVVMGNEVDGVSDELIARADLAVEIPMLGIKQSLNVSVAYGIIMYHLLAHYKDNRDLNLDRIDQVS